jgi:2'-5' RNA ligase
MSFVLIAASEDQRDAWVKSIKSAKALAEVGTLITEDVLRLMLWEIASNSLASYNSEGSNSVGFNKRASVYSPHLTIGRNRAAVSLGNSPIAR